MEAQITQVLEHKQLPAVLLSESLFRTAGGGQPCDFGKITGDGFEAKVVSVIKDQGSGDGEEDNQFDSSGQKIHVLEVVNGQPTEGASVALELDQVRRDALTRMHTGEHVLFQAIKRQYPKLTLQKIELDVDESSIFVYHPQLDYDSLLNAEKLANTIISEDRPVHEDFAPKEKAADFFDVRIKPERIKSDTVRIIKVDDFDTSACSGSHCTSTGQIGHVFITKINSLGEDRWQISFGTDSEKTLSYAVDAKKTLALLNAEPGQLCESVERLRADRDAYKESFRALSKQYLQTLVPEQKDGFGLIAHYMPGFEVKQLREAMGTLQEKNETPLIIVFVTERQAFVAVKGVDKSANDILQPILTELGGRGGGKPNFAQGGFPEDVDGQSVLTKITEVL